ncbi:MAG: hypothetical protein NXI04_23390 [Planctomycetaceae bacterium]|nr:hypothetical protein [Planctomycetaceae bacterium]
MDSVPADVSSNPFLPPDNGASSSDVPSRRRSVSVWFAIVATAGTAVFTTLMSVYVLAVVPFGDIAPGGFATRTLASLLVTVGLICGWRFEPRTGICLVIGLSGLSFWLMMMVNVTLSAYQLTRHSVFTNVAEMLVWACVLCVLACAAVGGASRWRQHRAAG